MRDKAREKESGVSRDAGGSGRMQKREAPIRRCAAPLAAHWPLRCTAHGSCCRSIKWTPSWLAFRPSAGATIALALPTHCARFIARQTLAGDWSPAGRPGLSAPAAVGHRHYWRRTAGHGQAGRPTHARMLRSAHAAVVHI